MQIPLDQFEQVLIAQLRTLYAKRPALMQELDRV